MAKKDKETKVTEVDVTQEQVDSQQVVNQDSDLLLEVFGRIAALEQRLDALEARPEPSGAVLKNDWGRAVVANPQDAETDSKSLETKRPSGPEAVARNADAIANQRAEAAAKVAAAKGTAFPFERLSQLAAELEGENISGVLPRLTGLQQVGKVVDFRILKVGSVRPTDDKNNRILVTVDSVGLVVRAEVG